MRKYIVNKNFIPREFIIEKNKDEKNRNKKMIFLLLIINFMTLPKSLEIIKNLLEKNNSMQVISTNVEMTNNKKEELLSVLNYISKDVIAFSFSNNSGTIEIENKIVIYYLEEETNLKINSIRKVNDKSYLVEVSL